MNLIRPGMVLLLWLPLCGCSCSPRCSVEKNKVYVGDQSREYRIVLPPKHSLTGVVIVFHGAGDTPESMADYSRLDDLARLNLAVVYPAGRFNNWRADAEAENPDLAFFDALLVDLERQDLPAERVHLVGMSQGAAFAHTIAAQRADRIASLTAHSGWIPKDLPEPSRHDFPVLLIHGAQDQQVPFDKAEAARQHYEQLGHDVELLKDPNRGHVWSPLANAKITLLLQRAASKGPRD